MSTALQPGSIFASDFRIVRALDAGGMGSIFVVDQISTGNQRALKLMLPQLVADPKLRERFLQEARVGSRIASDHVVQVIAAGVEPTQNVPWLAMELLNGEELDKRLARQGPFAPAEVAEILRQLGHALSAAHAVGVVHRDLKPQNIFLCRPRVAGTPFLLKVLDFGIAKVVAEAQTTGTSGMGTPLWMAPEQTESKSHVGPGTDIWALGLLVYWMLTGQIYWRSANAESRSVHAVLREMLMEPIAPPSVRAAEQGRAGLVPPGFDNWFLHAVERSLERRYGSVERAVADLLGVLEAARAGQQAPGPTIAAAPLPTALPMGTAMPSGPAPQAVPLPMTAGPQGTSAPYPQQQMAATPQGAWQSAPGFAATPPPKAKSANGVIIGVAIGLVALTGIGGTGAYFMYGGDDHHKSGRHRGDDDDDDTPVRKKHKKDDDSDDDKSGESKQAQCKRVIDTLTAAKTELDGMSNLQNPSIKDVRAVANKLDSVSGRLDALSLTDEELKGHVADYGALMRELANTLRGMADEIEVQNRPAAVKLKADLDASIATEPAITSAINTYCGAVPP